MNRSPLKLTLLPHLIFSNVFASSYLHFFLAISQVFFLLSTLSSLCFFIMTTFTNLLEVASHSLVLPQRVLFCPSALVYLGAVVM